MAARSSAGVGMVITVVLLGVLSLGLFITTVIFYGEMRSGATALGDLETQLDDFVTRSERDQASIQAWRGLADQENQSVVGYLIASYDEATAAAVGSRGLKPEQFSQQLARIDGAQGSSLSSVIAGVRRDLNTANDNIRRLEADRAASEQEVETARQRLAAAEDRHRAAIDTLEADIQRYSSDVGSYRDRVQNIETSFSDTVNEIRSSASSTEGELRELVNELRTENIILKEQLVRLRGDDNAGLRPRGEAALVDGEILGRNTVSNTVELSIGNRDRVQLGMSFSVYGSGNEITVDPVTGDYSRPKGTVEVIRVDDSTSTARVLRSQQGNPMVRGDVIANPIYDPEKVYSFVVFGLFDTNGDGQATALERDGLNAMIEEWGGDVVGDLDGSVDFLVLGQRPTLPPEPQPGDPIPVIQEYVRQRDLANRYDELFQRAEATAIPVLNENRLYTLLGKRPGRTR